MSKNKTPQLDYLVYELQGRFYWTVSYNDIEYSRSLEDFETQAQCVKDYNHFHMFLGEYINRVANSSWSF